MNYFICRTPRHYILARIFDQKNIKIVNLTGSKILFNENFRNENFGLFSFLWKIIKTRDEELSFYVFNDSNMVEFLILKFTSKKISKYYIEDGEAAYNGHELKYKSSSLVRFLDKIFGRKLQKRIGQSSFLEKGFYFFPNYVLDINDISHEIFLFPLKHNFIDILNELKQGVSLEEMVGNPEALVLGSKFPDLEVKIERYVRTNITTNYIIKEHPLKKKPSPEGVKYVNKLIPAELLPIILPNLKYLIGYKSSALYTVKILFPELEVILISDRDLVNEEFYINAGVKIVLVNE